MSHATESSPIASLQPIMLIRFSVAFRWGFPRVAVALQVLQDHLGGLALQQHALLAARRERRHGPALGDARTRLAIEVI